MKMFSAYALDLIPTSSWPMSVKFFSLKSRRRIALSNVIHPRNHVFGDTNVKGRRNERRRKNEQLVHRSELSYLQVMKSNRSNKIHVTVIRLYVVNMELGRRPDSTSS